MSLFADGDFHWAMDGKLAGILERNDGVCHLNGTTSGYYDQSTLMDYPSISHISSVAQKNSFVLIFAVMERYEATWKAMAEMIPGRLVYRIKSSQPLKNYDILYTFNQVHPWKSLRRTPKTSSI